MSYEKFCRLRDQRKPGAEISEYTEAQAFDLAIAAPVVAPVEPERMNTDQSREYLVDFMTKHFTDKTYHRYIRGERGSVNLAGDFAWQMARALRLVSTPVAVRQADAPFQVGPSIPEWLRRISELMRTQDEQCTADAMFVVEQRRLLIGLDTDYSQGPEDIVWCVDDSNIFQADEEFADLERAYDENGAVRENYSRHSFIEQWFLVTAFFTEKDAGDFVERHSHKYDGSLRVTVECEMRNRQWAMLREWILSLSEAPTSALDQPVGVVESAGAAFYSGSEP